MEDMPRIGRLLCGAHFNFPFAIFRLYKALTILQSVRCIIFCIMHVRMCRPPVSSCFLTLKQSQFSRVDFVTHTSLNCPPTAKTAPYITFIQCKAFRCSSLHIWPTYTLFYARIMLYYVWVVRVYTYMYNVFVDKGSFRPNIHMYAITMLYCFEQWKLGRLKGSPFEGSVYDNHPLHFYGVLCILYYIPTII